MSLAEILREEGRTEGRIDTAKSLLAEGMEPAFVAKVTKLSLDKIKALQKKKKN